MVALMGKGKAQRLDQDGRLTGVWRRLRRGSLRGRLTARNELVETYHDLVVYHAQRLWSRLPAGVELDDLISAGTFGLMQAIDAYDPERGIKFQTYAAGRIRGAMLDELRSMDWVPRLVRSKATRLAEARATLQVRLGREPTEVELRDQLRIEPHNWPRWLRDAEPLGMWALDTDPPPIDGPITAVQPQAELLIDPRAIDPQTRAVQLDRLRIVTRELSEQERLIVILYYYERLTLREIGATLGCSESRVSQLHRELIARLRVALEAKREEWD